MHEQRFNDELDSLIDRVRMLLSIKGAEYSSNTNRFHQFDQAAALSGLNRRQALAGMMVKHVVSVFDLINSDPDAYLEIPIERWDEKIIDNINYLILLRIMLAEEYDTTKGELFL